MDLAFETIAAGDSFKLMEAREPMTLLIKRKAESDPAEESGDEIEESGYEIEGSGYETEESGYEIEESEYEIEGSGNGYVDDVEEINEYFRSQWIEPAWDVDSFDGLEYDSSEEEDKFTDEEDEQKWRRFKRQHIENKGFYVDPELWPLYNYTEYIAVSDMEKSAGFGQNFRQYFSDMACLCLQKFNEDQKETDENVEFVEVVRGIYTANGRPKSFITFMARERPDGPLVEYQAKVWSTVVQGENYPILCRPAPPPKASVKMVELAI